MPNSQLNYDFNEHRHRYAVWTAARAVQRSFTTTSIINEAINQTSLRAFAVEAKEMISQKEFDELQTNWCNNLIENFSQKSISCSYGRASKIIAIYLKTAVILPAKGEGNICDIIHPPIDFILLKALSKDVDGLKELSQMRWTQFSKEEYEKLIKLLSSHNLPFNWRLEEYWKPEKEKRVKDDLFFR